MPIQHRGQPHVLYIGRDITQAKRAERALRDSEEQYRAIFNASADALVLRDADYRAVEVNPAYTTMSGYTREEVMAADRVLTQADPDDAAPAIARSTNSRWPARSCASRSLPRARTARRCRSRCAARR